MDERPSILYVDDESDNLTAFKVIFRRQYNVFTTPYSKEAITLMQQHPIDLVLSDYKMPKMNGVELLSYIKDHHPDVCRLMVTGFGDLEEITKALQTGIIKGMINKPWNVEELKKILQESLSEH